MSLTEGVSFAPALEGWLNRGNEDKHATSLQVPGALPYDPSIVVRLLDAYMVDSHFKSSPEDIYKRSKKPAKVITICNSKIQLNYEWLFRKKAEEVITEEQVRNLIMYQEYWEIKDPTVSEEEYPAKQDPPLGIAAELWVKVNRYVAYWFLFMKGELTIEKSHLDLSLDQISRFRERDNDLKRN